MILQLAIGTLLITLTIIIQVLMLVVLAYVFNRMKQRVHGGNKLVNNVILMVVSVLWLV